jgi:hypothetical protein
MIWTGFAATILGWTDGWWMDGWMDGWIKMDYDVWMSF